ncbi:2-oxo acid dehydrogenase subunit E2 [Spiroplasma turonicum]|uniref:2-oxoacid dehydrogenase acyltransferase catalytic domain-containing protein n=1 Tax=Spiroplasma turonicum TaxID=216946 RepID=A0A0K1P524_9MOLU|nr:2-oxo acid dehydrogenase subunit E2 [Spiroplasma turonicum]AKU79383.1 hypothetical protein STURON_00137 [Spiroplasma turonicum]ALX70405.1 hypothetical protein STURO_v1c01360 [Spiroplasma turonicum]
MVHLRARNLPLKGILKDWLFKGNHTAFGEDFALIKLEDGREVKIKSNYNGMITKTIKIGSPVKNGSILANIAIGEKEIQKLVSKSNKKSNDNKEIDIPEAAESRLVDAETDADTFSGAVVYNKYNQAITPFSSTSEDIKDTPEKMKEIEDKDLNIMASPSTNKDRFAQMRENIRNSIKNAPQNKLMGDLPKEELLKITNSEILNSSGNNSNNLFAKDDLTGVSKFRQIIQARKEKLLEENDFKEVEDNTNQLNAMSKLDEKGRPLIMRNIIKSRIEKLAAAGGDTSVLERDIVATKENAIIDSQRSAVMQNQNRQQDFNKLMNNNNEDSYMRQRSSEDGDFGVSYGGYVEDKEPTVIDANSLSKYGGSVLPQKDAQQLVGELNSKGQKTYAESKLSSLYDNKKRWNLIKDRDERNVINLRRQAVEQGLNEDKMLFSKAIKKTGLPAEFTKEVPFQNPDTGKVEYIRYMDTPRGSKEFEGWLRASNLYTAYKDEMKYLNSGEPVNANNNFNDLPDNKYVKTNEEHNMNQNISSNQSYANNYSNVNKFQNEQINQSNIPSNLSENVTNNNNNINAENINIENELIKQGKELQKQADEKVAAKAINYLQKEIAELKSSLEQQNQLNNATNRLNQQSHFQGTNDLFGQMMQYMLMQNMMQNLNPKKDTNIDDIKSLIKNEIKDFTNKINTEISQEEEVSKLKKETEKLREELKVVSFEKQKPDNTIGYLNYENNQENKFVERTRVNENRNSAVKSMILSQSYIPPLTISTDIDMSSILKLKHVLRQTQSNVKFTTIAFIAKTISIALRDYPKLNSSYDPETNELVIKKFHNIGLATETSEGLIIPVLKFVEKLTIKEVAIDIKEITQRLRRGIINDYESEGSTITIANYGNIGAIQATPTIFYPNAAVIGVGKIVKKPVVVDNEKLAIKAIMNMSLTVDQRIIDAAEAGRFMARVKQILEKPEMLTVS